MNTVLISMVHKVTAVLVFVSDTMLRCVSRIGFVVEAVPGGLVMARVLCTDTHMLHDEVVGICGGVVSVSEELTNVVCIVRLDMRQGGLMPTAYAWLDDLDDSVVTIIGVLQSMNTANGPRANVVTNAIDCVLDGFVVPFSKLNWSPNSNVCEDRQEGEADGESFVIHHKGSVYCRDNVGGPA